jgi:hypothetical protein
MKRFFSLGLITVGILLLSGVVNWSYFGNLTKQPGEVSLPDSIAGLKITNITTGDQAMADFENLHDKQFPVTSGSIGIYGNNEITLWAAGAPSETIASEMTNSMTEKIAKGNSPFTPLEQITQGNRTIYVLEGMGQQHYYFQSNNLVIWLAVSPALADRALQQTLEVYP